MSIRIRQDREANAVYLYLQEVPVVRTVEIRPDLNVDVAADGSPVGIERLGRIVVGLDDLLDIVRAARWAETDDGDEPVDFSNGDEPPPSAATIASIMAVVDAPYRPGLDVVFAEEDDTDG